MLHAHGWPYSKKVRELETRHIGRAQRLQEAQERLQSCALQKRRRCQLQNGGDDRDARLPDRLGRACHKDGVKILTENCDTTVGWQATTECTMSMAIWAACRSEPLISGGSSCKTTCSSCWSPEPGEKKSSLNAWLWRAASDEEEKDDYKVKGMQKRRPASVSRRARFGPCIRPAVGLPSFCSSMPHKRYWSRSSVRNDKQGGNVHGALPTVCLDQHVERVQGSDAERAIVLAQERSYRLPEMIK